MPTIPFKMPTPEDQKKALEKFKLPPDVAPYFTGIKSFWKTIPEPDESDWLYSQEEEGQPYSQYEFMLEMHKINKYEH